MSEHLETLLRESGATEKVERLMRPNGAAEMIRAKIIHPALHFENDFACLSVALPGPAGKPPVWHLVTSHGEVIPHADLAAHSYTASVLPKIEGHGFLNRWRTESIHAFKSGVKGDFKKITGRIVTMSRYLFDAPESMHVLIAAWVIGTYFYRLFPGFPYLNILGGMATGKSKLEEFLAAVAFNAIKSESVSAAVLYRLVHATGATILFDDLENWGKDEKSEIMPLVNSGYRQEAWALRMVGEGKDHVAWFNAYSPKAFAGIRGIGDVTSSRTVEILMQRGKDRDRLNRGVRDIIGDLAEARDLLYILALSRFRDVTKANDADTAPAFLVGRARELWRPLFAIADCVQADAPEFKTRETLEEKARETHGEGNCMSERTENTLVALRDLATDAESVIYPGQLAAYFGTKPGERNFRAESGAFGAELTRLGFKGKGRTKQGKRFRVTMDQLADVLARYPLPPKTDTLDTLAGSDTPTDTPPKCF
ncbi:MAG: hypothetical protein HYT87_11530 [Nitrospirae bacterium]|nr:hypothetical protein [Nitrospirota bacterium]